MGPSTSTAPAEKSPDANLQEEIGKLLGHRMAPCPQIEPDTPRPQFENDIERIMSAVTRLTSSSIESLESLTSELFNIQKCLKSEVARVEGEVDNALTGIKIIMETIAPLRSISSEMAAATGRTIRSGPAALASR
jgi:hypothetical protein